MDRIVKNQSFQDLNNNSNWTEKKDGIYPKIVKQGEMIVVGVNANERYCIDLGQFITLESIRQLGLELEELTEIKTINSFRNNKETEEMARIEYKLYRQKYLQKIKDIIGQIKENKRRQNQDSSIFNQTGEFFMNKQRSSRHFSDLRYNPNYSKTMNYFRNATGQNVIVNSDSIVQPGQGVSNQVRSLDATLDEQIHKYNRYKSQKQNYARIVIEDETKNVQLLDQIKYREMRSTENYVKNIKEKVKLKKQNLGENQDRYDRIVQARKEFFCNKQKQLKEIRKRLKQNEERKKGYDQEVKQKFKKIQQVEKKKLRRSIFNREHDLCELDERRESINQELESDINYARMFKLKGQIQQSERMRAKSQQELDEFMKKHKEIQKEMDHGLLEIKYQMIEKNIKAQDYQQQKIMKINENAKKYQEKQKEYEQRLEQEQKSIQVQKQKHLKMRNEKIKVNKKVVEDEVKVKMQKSQDVWKMKLDNLKEFNERLERQSMYNFQQFKIKEHNEKYRKQKMDLMHQMQKQTKDKQRINQDIEKGRIQKGMEDVQYIISGKRLEYYDINDNLKMRGSSLMNQIIPQSDCHNELFQIVDKGKNNDD